MLSYNLLLFLQSGLFSSSFPEKLRWIANFAYETVLLSLFWSHWQYSLNNVHKSFQKFCILRLRGQYDDAILLIFTTAVSQTSVKNTVCVLAGYLAPVLQNGALKWKKKLTGVRSRAVTSDHTLKLKLCEEKTNRNSECSTWNLWG